MTTMATVFLRSAFEIIELMNQLRLHWYKRVVADRLRVTLSLKTVMHTVQDLSQTIHHY
jgi:hypothetical protein